MMRNWLMILLDYYSFHIPLFRCNWAHVGKGVKKFDWYTLVNLHQGQKEFVREPFILASQAKQIFYARENENSNWYIVFKAPPRGHYEYDDQHDENPIAQSLKKYNIFLVIIKCIIITFL